MTCLTPEEFVRAAEGERLPHLTDCKDCAARVRRLSETLSRLKQLPDGGSADRTASSSYGLRLWGILSMAASLLVCGAVLWTIIATPSKPEGVLPAGPDAQEEERIAALIELLGAEKLEDRGAAEAEILKFGEKARPALMKALESGDAEISGRAKRLLGLLPVAAEAEAERGWKAKFEAIDGKDRAAVETLVGRRPEFLMMGEAFTTLAQVRAHLIKGDDLPCRRWKNEIQDDVEAVYLLDDDWRLRVTYEGGKAKSHEISGLLDLREEIGEKLYPAVKLINGSTGLYAPDEGDPAALVRAVNALRLLGREEALRALRICSEAANRKDAPPPGGARVVVGVRIGVGGRPDREKKWGLSDSRIFQILRLLFVPKEGKAAAARIAGWDTAVRVPEGDRSWPIFPLALEEGLPFLIVSARAEIGQNLATTLDYCDKNCDLRPDPLVPSASPVDAADALIGSDKWKALFAGKGGPSTQGDEPSCRAYVRMQALRSAGLRPQIDDFLALLGPDAEAEWRRRADAVRKTGCVWNAQEQKFSPGR